MLAVTSRSAFPTGHCPTIVIHSLGTLCIVSSSGISVSSMAAQMDALEPVSELFLSRDQIHSALQRNKIGADMGLSCGFLCTGEYV